MPGRALLTVSLIIVLFCKARAQGENSNALPDTFYVYKPPVQFVTLLDTFKGKVVDTFDDNRVIILSTNAQWFGSAYLVAVKRLGGYNVVNALNVGSNADSVSCSRADVNGTGSDELVVRWLSHSGHTGWENSIHEHFGGVTVWDLDSLKILFAFQNYYSLQNWWSVYETDTTGELAYDQRAVIDSGGEYDCESYEVTFSKQQMQIQATNNCPHQGDMNKYPVNDKTVYRYAWTERGFVKRK